MSAGLKKKNMSVGVKKKGTKEKSQATLELSFLQTLLE